MPVKVGQILNVRIEEPHIVNGYDSMARLNGYVLTLKVPCGCGKWSGGNTAGFGLCPRTYVGRGSLNGCVPDIEG